MTDIDRAFLDNMLDSGEDFARSQLVKHKERGLMPFYHFFAPDHDPPMVVVPCDFENDEAKDFSIAAAHFISRQIKAKAVLFITESWMLMLKDKASKDGFNLDNPPLPSQHPDRIECVMLIASNGQLTRSRSLRIVRDKRNQKRVVALHRDKEADEALAGGDNIEVMCRMTDGLIEPKTVH